MRAEALSNSMEAPERLGVMRAEALPDSVEAPAGLAMHYPPVALR